MPLELEAGPHILGVKVQNNWSALYYVQAPPEQRLVLFSDYAKRMGDGRYLLRVEQPRPSYTTWQLWLPWLIYCVQGPHPRLFGQDQERPRFPSQLLGAWAQLGDGEGKDLYLVPWPNQYGHGSFQFHNCTSFTYFVELSTVDAETAVSRIIAEFFQAAFQYQQVIEPAYREPYRWLGYTWPIGRQPAPPREAHQVEAYYRRWENLSRKEVCKLAWGKVKLPFNLEHLLKTAVGMDHFVKDR